MSAATTSRVILPELQRGQALNFALAEVFAQTSASQVWFIRAPTRPRCQRPRRSINAFRSRRAAPGHLPARPPSKFAAPSGPQNSPLGKRHFQTMSVISVPSPRLRSRIHQRRNGHFESSRHWRQRALRGDCWTLLNWSNAGRNSCPPYNGCFSNSAIAAKRPACSQRVLLGTGNAFRISVTFTYCVLPHARSLPPPPTREDAADHGMEGG
jgi:hypothetical protein